MVCASCEILLGFITIVQLCCTVTEFVSANCVCDTVDVHIVLFVKINTGKNNSKKFFATGMIEITTGSSNSAITPIITVEEGTKVWHLVNIVIHVFY